MLYGERITATEAVQAVGRGTKSLSNSATDSVRSLAQTQAPSGAPRDGVAVAWSLLVCSLAIALRLPACHESFWVDELHSAWCVWGGLDDVAPRAELGHQMPFYFLGLWFWKGIAGSSELALRMSSVLAVAAACGVLTYGLARYTHSLVAGVTAGLILAIENNAIFFGTELRPFGTVILLSSIATVSFVRLVNTSSRWEAFPAWAMMTAACLIAALCQPTSAGVSAWLIGTLMAIWLWRRPRALLKFTLFDTLITMAAVGVGLTLWSMTLGDSWQRRDEWSSFASTESLADLAVVWSWRWLLGVPLAITGTAWMFGLGGGTPHRERAVVALAAVALLATSSYWWVSWIEWIPLWHRRYFIAALPIFAAIGGGTVGVVASRFHRSSLTWLTGVVLIGGLAFHQDLDGRLLRDPAALVVRGEDWRGAIRWVQSNSQDHDAIFVESGLIESRVPTGISASAPQIPDLYANDGSHYFCYPVLGPYRLSQAAAPISPDLALPQEVLYDDQRQVFLIVRRPATQIRIDQTKWGWVHGNRRPREIKRFGNVTVLRLAAGDR